MQNDQRLIQLTKWIKQDWPEATIEVASADASFRRYFRVFNNGKTTVAMDAPPEQEDCAPFLDVTQRLLDAGVHAPKIIRKDLEQGFLLLEDLGSEPYLDSLDQDSADQLYGDAMQALIKIQQANTKDLPEYDTNFLMMEMQFMPEWFLQTHLGISANEEQQNTINECLESIVKKLSEQPQVFVHRDYHSRNLMITADDNPGVIDYQDAMLGPITYDLVSLLRDCYIQWPDEQVKDWVLQFKQLLETAKPQSRGAAETMLERSDDSPKGDVFINSNEKHHKSGGVSFKDIDNDTFIEWFDYMGLQRHIKVLGIFARLNHRDGKSNYLNDLPLTLEYMMQISQKYEDTQPLFELFNLWNISQLISQKSNAVKA